MHTRGTKLFLLVCLISLLLSGCASQTETDVDNNMTMTIAYKNLVHNIFSGDSFFEQYAIPIAFGKNNDKIFYYTYSWDTEKPITFSYYLIKDGTHHKLLDYPYKKVFNKYHMNMDLFKKGQWSDNGQYLAFIADFEKPKILFIYDLSENSIEIIEDVNDFSWVGDQLFFPKIKSYLGNDKFKTSGFKTYKPGTMLIKDIGKKEDFVSYDINNEVMFSNDYKYVLSRWFSSTNNGAVISVELGKKLKE